MLNFKTKYPFTLQNIHEIAKQIISKANVHKIFLVDGEMGSGKTTLIKSICNSLKSSDNMSSPTFSLINEYQYPLGKIFHFDLYRLKNTEELLDIGFEDYINSGHYCFIEWPELAKKILQNNFIIIDLTVSENNHYLCLSEF